MLSLVIFGRPAPQRNTKHLPRVHPIQRIRKAVFLMSQAQFAEAIGSRQSTVSRWETGKHQPSLDDLARIRRAAIERGMDWSDSWFFESPVADQQGPREVA